MSRKPLSFMHGDKAQPLHILIEPNESISVGLGRGSQD